MYIVRYANISTGEIRVGRASGELVEPLPVQTLSDLLAFRLADLRALMSSRLAGAQRLSDVAVLPAVDGDTEIWAAGVTYIRSRDARVEESRASDVYDLVYGASRPELFFKSMAWRVVTDGEPIGFRTDSSVNVPEPELALVVNAHGEVIGYTICNDVSSRSIEGENPLYLPQAKVYAGSCSLSGHIRLAWELPDKPILGIGVTVMRGGSVAWADKSSTEQLARPLTDLVEYLFAAQSFPAGVVISTGTGCAPPMAFTLSEDDVVTVTIDEVGTLTNPVVSGKAAFDWLSAARTQPLARLQERRVTESD
jgi:2-dehydro-3-deoxy-D-arabinonate dehydratase